MAVQFPIGNDQYMQFTTECSKGHRSVRWFGGARHIEWLEAKRKLTCGECFSPAKRAVTAPHIVNSEKFECTA
jgi:hypothetical protein